LFSIACFVYITINAYYFVYQDKENGIKVIKSPEGAIKVQENGDGIAIKNIDKTIYDNVVRNKKFRDDNLNNVKIVEQAGTPLASSDFTEAIEIATISKKDQPKIPNKSPIDVPIKSANLKKIENSKSSMMVYGDKNGESELSNVLLTDSGNSNTNRNVKSDPNPIRGVSRVQVAALSSKISADSYWKKLNKNYANLFSGLKYFIIEVNVASKGTFYRLQIGNFRNQVEAENFCRKFISKAGKSKSDCIIVE
ncbi:MAG: hypothetical protein ACJAZX_001624, partial [Rickettsiales bacterium]